MCTWSRGTEDVQKYRRGREAQKWPRGTERAGERGREGRGEQQGVSSTSQLGLKLR